MKYIFISFYRQDIVIQCHFFGVLNPPQFSKVHLEPQFLEHWHHLIFPSLPVAPSGDTVVRPQDPWSNHWNDLPNARPRSCDRPQQGKEHHPLAQVVSMPRGLGYLSLPKINECALKNAGWKMKVPFEMVPFAGDIIIFEGVFFGWKIPKKKVDKKVCNYGQFWGEFEGNSGKPPWGEAAWFT